MAPRCCAQENAVSAQALPASWPVPPSLGQSAHAPTLNSAPGMRAEPQHASCAHLAAAHLRGCRKAAKCSFWLGDNTACCIFYPHRRPLPLCKMSRRGTLPILSSASASGDIWRGGKPNSWVHHRRNGQCRLRRGRRCRRIEGPLLSPQAGAGSQLPHRPSRASDGETRARETWWRKRRERSCRRRRGGAGRGIGHGGRGALGSE